MNDYGELGADGSTPSAPGTDLLVDDKHINKTLRTIIKTIRIVVWQNRIRLNKKASNAAKSYFIRLGHHRRSVLILLPITMFGMYILQIEKYRSAFF